MGYTAPTFKARWTEFAPTADSLVDAVLAEADAAAKPSWEAAARHGARSISANIKPKRRVAALFKSE